MKLILRGRWISGGLINLDTTIKVVGYEQGVLVHDVPVDHDLFESLRTLGFKVGVLSTHSDWTLLSWTNDDGDCWLNLTNED